mmetsp:Transcript_50727/g.153567  ORF Transcript_50727/g.153567 Transcript_50727/m.153567 type:complete len:318 (-) Transcript_50727:14-967(-)
MRLQLGPEGAVELLEGRRLRDAREHADARRQADAAGGPAAGRGAEACCPEDQQDSGGPESQAHGLPCSPHASGLLQGTRAFLRADGAHTQHSEVEHGPQQGDAQELALQHEGRVLAVQVILRLHQVTTPYKPQEGHRGVLRGLRAARALAPAVRVGLVDGQADDGDHGHGHHGVAQGASARVQARWHLGAGHGHVAPVVAVRGREGDEAPVREQRRGKGKAGQQQPMVVAAQGRQQQRRDAGSHGQARGRAQPRRVRAVQEAGAAARGGRLRPIRRLPLARLRARGLPGKGLRGRFVPLGGLAALGLAVELKLLPRC